MPPVESNPDLLKIKRRQEVESEVRTLGVEETVNKILALEAKIKELEELASKDGMTKLLNKVGFEEALEQNYDHLRRHPDEDPGVLLVIDLDGFKEANDNFGHHAGDEALKKFAQIINEDTRLEDLKGRTGGDEFRVHLWGATVEQASDIFARINNRFTKETSEFLGGREILSISIGAAEIDPNQDPKKVTALADERMYQNKRAKKEERKRVRDFENAKVRDEQQEIADNLGLKGLE